VFPLRPHRIEVVHDLHQRFGALHLLGRHAARVVVGGVEPVAHLGRIIAHQHRQAAVRAHQAQGVVR
jgi:hypothetical protein